MDAHGFRRLALSLPEAVEAGHMGHPDFRVGGRIFATLGYPDGAWAMVKLLPDQQEALVAADPLAFAPVKGAWGRGGATLVRLRKAKVGAVRTALLAAWRNAAPARLRVRVEVGREETVAQEGTMAGKAKAAGKRTVGKPGRAAAGKLRGTGEAKAAGTVAAYLAGLPQERRAALEAVRKVVRRHLPKGYREGVGWGGITWEVPLRRYPDTYNGKPLAYACLAAHKSYCALYLMGVYQEPAQAAKLKAAFAAAGKKADMGQSCIRFRTPDDLPLETIGALVASTPVDAFIARYEASRRR